MWQGSLEYRMHEVCPHCGNHWEEVIEYVKTHDNDPVALYLEAIKLNKYQQEDLANMILSSSYNIFVPWYKAFLLQLANKSDSFRAADILNYYSEEFDKVEINKAELL